MNLCTKRSDTSRHSPAASFQDLVTRVGVMLNELRGKEGSEPCGFSDAPVSEYIRKGQMNERVVSSLWSMRVHHQRDSTSSASLPDFTKDA